jgi:tetratricopeptide (TPR) repeat protein
MTCGRPEAAIADLDKAISLWVPELAAKARALRARAYYLLRDYDKATLDLDAAQKVDPNDPDNFLIRGSVDYDQKRYAATARDFFSKRNPHDPGGHFGRGMALEADSRFDEALVAYEIAIKLDPTDGRAITGRDRVKRRACEASLCLNAAPEGSGWWSTVGRP